VRVAEEGEGEGAEVGEFVFLCEAGFGVEIAGLLGEGEERGGGGAGGGRGRAAFYS